MDETTAGTTHAQDVETILASRDQPCDYLGVRKRREAVLITEVERLRAASEVTAAQLAALEAVVQASLFAGRCPLCGYLPHTDDCPLRDGYDLDRLVTNHQTIKRETEAWLRKKLEAL